MRKGRRKEKIRRGEKSSTYPLTLCKKEKGKNERKKKRRERKEKRMEKRRGKGEIMRGEKREDTELVC